MFDQTTKEQSYSYFNNHHSSNSSRNATFLTFPPPENWIFSNVLIIGREYQILRKGISRVWKRMYPIIQTSIAQENIIAIDKLEDWCKIKGKYHHPLAMFLHRVKSLARAYLSLHNRYYINKVWRSLLSKKKKRKS